MPEEQIKVGILGAGYIADWHIKALRTLRQVRIVAVCDANLTRAQSMASRYGIRDAVSNLDELVKDRRCDAVHILLPPDLHFSSAMSILEAGCHVFIEKPACLTETDCRKLADKGRHIARSIGVGHNFLFAPIYERLKADVVAGMLGPINDVSIVWNKELGQLHGGPFGGWMFRSPGNVILEIGPHSVGHLLDLVGEPDRLTVARDQETMLPNGQMFFRRWSIQAGKGSTACHLAFNMARGFTEHRIHVRGAIGSATVDFEAGTYVLRRNSPLPDDFDRARMTGGEGKALIRQGRKKLWRYVLSKFKLSKQGNDFGTSITRCISQFYADIDGVADPRLSIDFATRVVSVCSQIATSCSEKAVETGSTARAPILSKPATVLVLGGTGFIGQALIKQLVDAGHGVRILARDPRHLPRLLQALPLEVVKGDLGKSDDLEKAMTGIRTVCHLARAHVKTWEEYVREEIGGTRNVAEACLKTGVQRLLYTGTIDSYYAGESAVITDDTPLDPKIQRRNLYARAKAESERLLLALRDEKQLPVAIFRPGIVIGKGGSPFHWGVGIWTGSSVCRVWGDGTNPLPIVLVDDVVRALVAAVDAEGVIGQVFNLVGEPLLNGQDYLAELEKASGMKIEVRLTSPGKFYRGDMFKWLIKVMVRHPERRLPSYRDWKSRTQRAIFDCTKAKRVLGWAPASDRETIVREGIELAVTTWYD